MFGRKKKAPEKPFTHAEGCPIVKADASVEIPWNYDGDGLWKAECVHDRVLREPITDDRVRSTRLIRRPARHLVQCECVSETDPAVIKVLLKVTDKGDYDWVECGSCEAGWQVAHCAQVSAALERGVVELRPWSQVASPDEAIAPDRAPE